MISKDRKREMGLFEKLLGKKKTKNVGALAAFEKKYTMTDRILGTGSYAEVRLAIRKKDNEKVAVKIIDKENLSQKELRGLSKEVSILQSLRHKNVVKLHDWYEEPEVMYVVMEFVGGGELFEMILQKDAPFTEGDARRIIGTLAEALKHCKDRGIIHRDIKPQNLLLTEPENGGHLKLADFNLSIQLDPDSVNFSVIQTMCGTPNYVAPEILSGKPYDFKCDVWSLGVICFLLLSGGYLPFYVDEEGALGKEKLLKKVKQGKWGFYPHEAWENVSEDAKDFLKKVMEKSPEKRLNYSALMNHPWLKSTQDTGCSIDTRAFQQSLYMQQLQCATTVMLAAKKFERIMRGEGKNTTEMFTRPIQGHITNPTPLANDSVTNPFEDDAGF